MQHGGADAEDLDAESELGDDQCRDALRDDLGDRANAANVVDESRAEEHRAADQEREHEVVPLRRECVARGAEEQRADDAEHRRDEHGDAAEARYGAIVQVTRLVGSIEQMPVLRTADHEGRDDRCGQCGDEKCNDQRQRQLVNPAREIWSVMATARSARKPGADR